MKQPTAPELYQELPNTTDLYPELPKEDRQNYRLQKITEIEKELIKERDLLEYCLSVSKRWQTRQLLTFV